MQQPLWAGVRPAAEHSPVITHLVIKVGTTKRKPAETRVKVAPQQPVTGWLFHSSTTS